MIINWRDGQGQAEWSSLKLSALQTHAIEELVVKYDKNILACAVYMTYMPFGLGDNNIKANSVIAVPHSDAMKDGVEKNSFRSIVFESLKWPENSLFTIP